MKITATDLPEVMLIEPKVFRDNRGFFYESFNQNSFDASVGQKTSFVQDNHSRSTRGVLRGMHYQLPPRQQGKLVRVTRGAVFDVAVDLRRNSDRYGDWVGVEISEENGRQLWIPAGFAHGFLVLSESADFLYKTTDYYSPQYERSFRWDDPAVGIEWPRADAGLVISDKDAAAPDFADATPF